MPQISDFGTSFAHGETLFRTEILEEADGSTLKNNFFQNVKMKKNKKSKKNQEINNDLYQNYQNYNLMDKNTFSLTSGTPMNRLQESETSNLNHPNLMNFTKKS